MTVHPVAELFPMMEGDEWEDFLKDVQENGLQEPIVYDQHGQLLDGRNRLKACEQVGIPVESRTVTTNDPTSYILSANVHRRHLNASQRAMIGARIQGLPVGRPKSYPEGNFTEGDEPPLLSREEMAGKLGISPSTLSKARAVVAEADPQDIAAVDRGETSAKAVVEKITERKQQEKKARMSEKELLKRKLVDQKRKIGTLNEKLNEMAGFLREVEIEPEHTPADIEEWIEGFTEARRKITVFLNRLKGV